MSQLLHCACGGQFAVKLKPHSTEWQCPYCGVACSAPGLLPESLPVSPPITRPLISEPTPYAVPPLVASPVAIFPDNSHVGRSVNVSVAPRRGSQNPLWLIGAVGVGLLFIVITLSLSQSLSRSRRPAHELATNTPKKRATVAAKQVSPPVTRNSSARPAPSNIPVIMPRDDPPEVHTPANKEMTELEQAVASVEPRPGPPLPSSLSPVPEPMAVTAFPGRLTALVKSHCVECHDATNQDGGLRLDDLAGRTLDGDSPERWRKVLRRLKSEEMPPPKASSLSSEDRSYLVTWLQSQLQALAERGPPRPTVRRLNRAEYVNSVQALTGLPLQSAAVIEDVISTGFDTDAAELNLSPQLMRQYVQLARAIAVELRKRNTPLPGSKLKLFGGADEIGEPSAVAEEARRRLQPFAQAAFRRPVEEAKLERLTQIVVEKTAAKQGFDDGMQLAVQAVLCSPQFLLLTDLDKVSDDYALAAKLSYFLWSGPPDSPLLDLAENNTLRDGENLREQVARMLKDPRSRALADNFGGQWLGTRELGVMQPDEEVFPNYSPLLEASFREETHRFFEYVLRQNLSITTFLDADFALVNEPLAQLYGIPGVRGIEIRKVSLKPHQHRGGILTQGTILSITSDGVRSSPVIRGVWILENILGDPPAPPPADVPDLESDTRGTKTIREELAQHRQIESCNSCHRKIDPLGFALENYDAIGQWRTNYRSETPADALPVDNKGELPDGTTLVGIVPLKKALLQRKHDFARCLAEKLLSYGCGRTLDVRDEAAVGQIIQATEAGGYRLQTMVQAVVQTPAFCGQ